MGLTRTGAPLLCCLAASCSTITGLGDFELAGDTTTTAAGGTSGRGGGGTTASAGGGGDGGTGAGTGAAGGGAAGGAGGGGGQGGTPVLVDRGLIARYYIDEADSGQRPAEIQDAAADPMPLGLTLEEETVSFYEMNGNRGFHWSSAGMSSKIEENALGSKIASRLHGSTTATVEVVLEATDTAPGGSYVFFLGLNADTYFSLEVLGNTAGFVWRGSSASSNTLVRAWFSAPVNRHVVHLVLDTSQQPAQAARLYRNGIEAPILVDGALPEPGEEIDLSGDFHIALGNHEDDPRSFEGTLYYTALYDSALTQAEAQNNAAVLLADDDTPAP